MSDFNVKCKAQLERDEGRRTRLYYDSLNIPTIGIGRNLQRPLSEDEVDYLFANDFKEHLAELLDRFPWAGSLDEARLGALLNMAFNLGLVKLGKFENMLSALKDGRWKDAAAHALNSVWASQVGLRAHRIAKQFEVGVWQ